jgi:superfamily I DNA/RNA helicase
MAGICLIEGGPGVGKTSVALHRIPYLLREQKDLLPMENSTWPTDFFEESNVQVIVWKEHLVRYLKDLLSGLYCHQVPVRHIEEWATDLLRRYVDVGAGPDKYRIQRPSEEDKQAEQMKLGLGKGKGHWCGVSLEMIETFLTGSQKGTYHRVEANESLRRFAEVIGQVNDRLQIAGLTPLLTEPASYYFTAAGIQKAAAALRRTLDHVEQTIRSREGGRTRLERERDILSRARDRVGQLRNAELDRLGHDHAATLFDLYRSDFLRLAFADHFTAAEIARFQQYATRCAERRSLSSGDRYVLLWIVRVLTRDAEIEKPHLRPLPLYSHTMVDEAQHYHPLVLRLLVDLSMPELHSMTIVGDLEQRMSQVEGLDDWKDIGIPPDRISHAYRLKTNYRWSREVFGFLDHFRKVASLKEELSAPPRWVSGEGHKPEIVRSANLDAQAEWLVQRIDELQQDSWARAWSIAVVVPAKENEWCRRVLEALQACGILARWAEGQDVHGCIEQVIMTTYESVIGLEFDAVFLPRCDEKLPAGHVMTDRIQAVWVAMTRARQFLALSHSAPLAIFDVPAFAPYRK